MMWEEAIQRPPPLISILHKYLFLVTDIFKGSAAKSEWKASPDPFIFGSFGFQSKIGSPPDFSKLSGRDDNINAIWSSSSSEDLRSGDSEDEPIGRPRILTDIPRPELSIPAITDEQEKVDDTEEDERIEADVELEGETIEPDDDPPQNAIAHFNGGQQQPPSAVACPPPPASPQRRPSSRFALTSPSRSWQPASSGRSGPLSCGTLETEVKVTVYEIFVTAYCTSSGKPLSFVLKSSSNSNNFVVEKNLCAQLQFDERFITIGARIPKGVLLVGPPDIMSWSSTTTTYFLLACLYNAGLLENLSVEDWRWWWKALFASFVWFLHRWKTNVFARTLSSQSLLGLDREKLLALDKISSIGLFVIGIMALAETCGYIGSIGKDKFGEEMKRNSKLADVNIHYHEDENAPTRTCVVCVIGGERSLVANLSAANCYKSEHAAPFICEFFRDVQEKALQYMDFVFGNETEAAGRLLYLKLGYSHEVELFVPLAVRVFCFKNNTICCIDKQRVHQFAATVWNLTMREELLRWQA
ncbi:Ribosomal protein L6, alpha-beta domain superfamily [Sesbania bispinosa]|nr:Ribosomal protein L6, alpha-beta domain superfamily [Sesbania bispinosa]